VLKINRDAMRQLFVDCLVPAKEALIEVGLMTEEGMTPENKALVVRLAGRGIHGVTRGNADKLLDQ